MFRIVNVIWKTQLLLGALAALASPSVAAGIAANASYTYSQVSPGVYDYAITLNNTGTTTVGTFWLSWVPGAGFLSAVPTSITNPAGWSDLVTNAGAAIQWTSTTNLLAAGQSLSGFSFASTETPTQLLGIVPGTGLGAGDPVTTSFVYITTKGANGDLGQQFVVTPAVVAATPEPDSLLLALTGVGMLAAAGSRKYWTWRRV